MNEEIGYREVDEPISVEFRDGMLVVMLADGRVVSVPLDWYPRLARASAEQLAAVEMSAFGLHWDALDEDISVRGILLGIGKKLSVER